MNKWPQASATIATFFRISLIIGLRVSTGNRKFLATKKYA